MNQRQEWTLHCIPTNTKADRAIDRLRIGHDFDDCIDAGKHMVAAVLGENGDLTAFIISKSESVTKSSF
ncbi:MAG: hypothetical protein R3F13_05300 [Prosthecobacter sp.]